jgi:hypothetical protein
MTITLVDVGTTANDGTGDPLRTAFQTVNTALTRLDNTVDVQTGYVLLKDDSGSAGVAVTTAGNVGVGTTSPTGYSAAANTLVVANIAGNVGVTIASSSSGTGNIYFADGTSGVSTFAGYIQYNHSNNSMYLGVNSATSIAMNSVGNVGISTTSPTEALDVNSDAFRVRTSQTPASASATGNAGTVCWDTNYIYVCTATNTWKRAALATW